MAAFRKFRDYRPPPPPPNKKSRRRTFRSDGLFVEATSETPHLSLSFLQAFIALHGRADGSVVHFSPCPSFPHFGLVFLASGDEEEEEEGNGGGETGRAGHDDDGE